MSPKVFFTGATGYIGGDAIARLYEAHPDWQYRCLVRDETKGQALEKAYPGVKSVTDSLDDGGILKDEAKNADIVLHLANADHAPSAQAIAKGLQSHSKSSPGFLIHCSGTAVLIYPDMDNNTWGEHSDKVWDDLDIESIHNIPDHSLHRKIDKMVFQAARDGNGSVRTAIVSPPVIYGEGRSKFNARSIQLPRLAAAMIERKQVFQVGKGHARWSHVHVEDLSEIWLLLAEAAAAGGGNATWDDEGYYFVENGTGNHSWGDMSAAMGKILHKKGLVDDAKPTSVSTEEVSGILPFGKYAWGSNSMSRANRARKYLGWEPKQPTTHETLENVVDAELARQGKA